MDFTLAHSHFSNADVLLLRSAAGSIVREGSTEREEKLTPVWLKPLGSHDLLA